MGLNRVGDMEIGQDLHYQRWEWRLERIGWWVILSILILAMLGLFGSGPLSSRTVGEPSGLLWMEYDYFLRRRAATTLRLHVTVGSQQEFTVWFDRAYWDALEVKSLDPPPLRSAIGPDRVQYTFLSTDVGQQVLLIFRLEADNLGPLAGRVGLGEKTSLDFRQFVYP